MSGFVLGENAVLQYIIPSGIADGKFAISTFTGEITTNATLDREFRDNWVITGKKFEWFTWKSCDAWYWETKICKSGIGFLLAQPSGARLIKSLWCMWVCGQVPPQPWPTRISPKIFRFRFSWDMITRWSTPPWPTRISPKIFHFRFSLDMVKDDWPPIWLTRISPKIFQFRFSWDMVKDDQPPFWPTRISPKMFQFRFSLDMVKDDWPPSDLPGSHLKCFSSD